MKKCFSFFAVSLALVLSASLISCKAPSGSSSSNASETTPTGDIALAKTTIGSVEYNNTAQVYVTRKDSAIIEGKANTENYKGVFVAGRKVKLSPYIMSKYEVTQELYTAVMTGQKVSLNGVEKILNPAPFFCTVDNDDYKVLFAGEEQKYRAADGVTWYDAVYFCNALSEKTDLTKAYAINVRAVDSNGNITDAVVTLVSGANGYRLPTEAEWEFAARGGDPTKPEWDYTFSGAAKADGSSYSDQQNTGLDAVGWYRFNTTSGTTEDAAPSSGSTGYGTHQVGKKAANTLGIFDMSGNVWEWCWDCHSDDVTKSDVVENGVVNNPMVLVPVDWRVSRGGSWNDKAHACPVCERGPVHPGERYPEHGFRVCRNAD